MTGVAGQRLDPATVNRQIGRILQQSQRAAARFAIVLLRPVQAAFEMHGRLRNARRANKSRWQDTANCSSWAKAR
jgi:hypothetical protein